MNVKKLAPVGVTCVLWAVLSTASQAITIRHDQPDLAYTALGTAYDSVAALRINALDGTFGCSGSKLLGSDFLVTAAHCLEGATSIDVSFGNQMTGFFSNSSAVPAEGWQIHPDWNPANIFNGGDLALVKLPSGSYPDGFGLYTDQSRDFWVETNVDLAGFGVTGTGFAGEDFYDGQKRRATNAIDGLWNENYLATDFTYPLTRRFGIDLLGSRQLTTHEGGMCFGDSGGALLMDGKLAGINSFIINGTGTVVCDYIDAFGHLRVSQYAGWINDTIANWGSSLVSSLTGSAPSVPSGISLASSPILPRASIEDFPLTPDRNPANVPEPSSALALSVLGAGLTVRSRLRVNAHTTSESDLPVNQT
jgi:hypothetical protein